MWRPLGLLVLAAVGTFSQEVEFDFVCNFQITQVLQSNAYGCILSGIEFELSVQDAAISVSGNHAEGQDNSDVRILQIHDSTFNNFPAQIFSLLPNIEAVEIANCGSFNFFASFFFAPNLIRMRMVYNRIPVLPQRAFPLSLEQLILYHNELSDLGVAPFEEMSNLWHLSLADNEINELLPSHLAALTALTGFYINNNTIEHLHDLFTDNHVLINAHFENNRIRTIGELFLDNVAESIQFLGLEGNVCVDENFGIDNLTTIEVVREAIQGCIQPTDGRFTFELHGNLTIFDQNGNELLHINN